MEHSILRCMTQRIRTARNFIYMENQYFLGSAYAWYEDQVIGLVLLQWMLLYVITVNMISWIILSL